MQYVDPYALFSFDVHSPEELDRSQLKRAKQKILAEFELSEDIVIDFNGKSLDKATVLQLLEDMESVEKRRHHWILHQHSSLRSFLENPQVRYLRNVPSAEQLGDESFRKFLGYYLAPIFDQVLTQNFKLKRKPEVSLLLQKFELLSPMDQDVAMKGVSRFLNLNIQAIRAVIEGGNDALMGFKDKEIYGSTLMNLMNRLPQAYQHLRNRYADALEDLAIALQNKVRLTNLAFNVICAAAELETDLTTREHVNHMKVEIWQRLRAQQKEATGWQHQNQTEPNTQTSNYWETTNPFDTPPIEKKKSKANLVSILVVIGIIILAVNLFRNSRKSYSGATKSKYTVEIPNINTDLMNSILDEADRNANNKEDLIGFFEALNLEDLPINKELATTRPESGASVFPNLVSGEGVKTIDELIIQNDSQKDLVVFKVDYLTWNVDRSIYIRAGEKVKIEDPIAGVRHLIPYSGTNWAETWVHYGGSSWGGFTQSRSSIPLDPGLTEDREPYAVVVLSEPESESMTREDSKTVIVKYDGAELSSFYK